MSRSPYPVARYPVEMGVLVALCFFLPLLEAPKNLLWVAYALTWLVNRVRQRDFGGPWDAWDTLIAAWIASGFMVAAFAGLDGQQWRGAGDPVRYGSVLWMVKRARYDAREQRWILGALVVSTLVGLAFGYRDLWRGTAPGGTLELHSVGHVNHTAIYLAIMLGVCAAWIFARWRSWSAAARLLSLAVTCAILVSLVVTASRGAIGIALVMLPVLAAAWWPRSRVPVAISAAVVAAVVVLVIAGGTQVVRKTLQNVQEENVLSFRDGVWRTALAAWRRYPWFGVGLDNYSLVSVERLHAWDTEAGRAFDPKRYYYTSHGHSIYANTLAERGLFGSAIVAAVLGAWALCLVRRRPRADDPDDDWLAWGSAAAAWTVTVGAGTVNTTLHHEHALLAVLLLGLFLSRLRQPAVSEPNLGVEASKAVPAGALAGERNH